jgi:hypothetical protein
MLELAESAWSLIIPYLISASDAQAGKTSIRPEISFPSQCSGRKHTFRLG